MRIILLSLVLTLTGFYSAARAEEADRPLQVCILSGCDTYKSEESLPPFQRVSGNRTTMCSARGVRSARPRHDLPGLEQLDDCDVLLVFYQTDGAQGRAVRSVQELCHHRQADRRGPHRQPCRANLAGVRPRGPRRQLSRHYNRSASMTRSTSRPARKASDSGRRSTPAVKTRCTKTRGTPTDIHVLLTRHDSRQASGAVGLDPRATNGAAYSTRRSARKTRSSCPAFAACWPMLCSGRPSRDVEPKHALIHRNSIR